jgi:hypothetical protein
MEMELLGIDGEALMKVIIMHVAAKHSVALFGYHSDADLNLRLRAVSLMFVMLGHD